MTAFRRRWGSPLLVAMTSIVMVAAPVVAETAYHDQEQALLDFVQRNPIGGSDYWLVKDTFAGPVRTMLVFGYADDGSACQELASIYRSRFPDAGYRCESAQ